MRDARAAVIVTRRASNDALWRMARETPWIDMKRVFVVGGGRQALLPVEKGQTGVSVLHITADAVPLGYYRRTGTVVAAASAVVQSFAARFIANELKRTNGSSP